MRLLTRKEDFTTNGTANQQFDGSFL